MSRIMKTDAALPVRLALRACALVGAAMAAYLLLSALDGSARAEPLAPLGGGVTNTSTAPLDTALGMVTDKPAEIVRDASEPKHFSDSTGSANTSFAKAGQSGDKATDEAPAIVRNPATNALVNTTKGKVTAAVD